VLIGTVLLAAGGLWLNRYGLPPRVAAWLPKPLAGRLSLMSRKSEPAATAEAPYYWGQRAAEVDTATPRPGGPLLDEAARRLIALPYCECKIRQRVEVMGQQLAGAGNYAQLATADIDRTRVRWELKFQVGDRLASVQQVNDGRFFWSRYDLPGRQTLGRVDLRTLRDVQQRETSIPPEAALRSWLALGGLSRLMQGLSDHFELGWAQPRVVETTPVWVLVGTWKPAALARLVPAAQSLIEQRRPVPIDRLPAHLPDLVVVVLSRDPRLPLFPYRVEYRRSRDGLIRGTEPPAAAPGRESGRDSGRSPGNASANGGAGQGATGQGATGQGATGQSATGQGGNAADVSDVSDESAGGGAGGSGAGGSGAGGAAQRGPDTAGGPGFSDDPLQSQRLENTSELAVLDLFEVNIETPPDPQGFVFQPPADQQAMDETDRFLAPWLATLPPAS
jgi:hypothetical protein